MFQRRGPPSKALPIALVIIVIVGGVYIYDLAQRLKTAEEVRDRQKAHKESLSAQLQVVYDHKGKLEKSLQDAKRLHDQYVKEADVRKSEDKSRCETAKNLLKEEKAEVDRKYQVLESQKEDGDANYAKLTASCENEKNDATEKLEQFEQDYNSMKNKKDDLITELEAKVEKLEGQVKLARQEAADHRAKAAEVDDLKDVKSQLREVQKAASTEKEQPVRTKAPVAKTSRATVKPKVSSTRKEERKRSVTARGSLLGKVLAAGTAKVGGNKTTQRHRREDPAEEGGDPPQQPGEEQHQSPENNAQPFLKPDNQIQNPVKSEKDEEQKSEEGAGPELSNKDLLEKETANENAQPHLARPNKEEGEGDNEGQFVAPRAGEQVQQGDNAGQMVAPRAGEQDGDVGGNGQGAQQVQPPGNGEGGGDDRNNQILPPGAADHGDNDHNDGQQGGVMQAPGPVNHDDAREQLANENAHQVAAPGEGANQEERGNNGQGGQAMGQIALPGGGALPQIKKSPSPAGRFRKRLEPRDGRILDGQQQDGVEGDAAKEHRDI